MTNISVVIPTMWKSRRAEHLLSGLESCEHVYEVIIVDNNPSERPDLSNLSKVVYVPQETNIYVNPAWNLGVGMAKEKYVCLINDDITIDVNLFFKACFESNRPAIGLSANCWNFEGATASVIKGHSLGSGWGCCIFLDREHWIDIPSPMKIWRGDAWIIKNYPSVHSMIIKARTEMETTSGRPEMTEIKKNDLKYWHENISN